ncbi:hypothetical protein BU24DRAFT_481206 [Aaosphaeria arxii CBS 175.79]|uniref:Uncharacterized protein n=1 Tax=Aaosphaeria arxii CBS 175.79 TaxID=1450172 RepID=A0A6A5XVB4_9PLEO|nr:uncharacterized protein BU24DRAFT_481206 [Aaosphaeria arxii CBS 175.79]KAF2016570.1 hypothetical protein BU24DRAFT_481206 [Aaosphaeria arxii CBS 175.79]
MEQQAQLPKPHKTRTTPVTTRTKITRHGSQPRPSPQRPTSSGGEIMLPYRGVTRRADSYSQPTPLEEFRKLRRWPPNYFRLDGELNQKQADDLICAGASTFKGYWDEITNAPPGYNRYYAVMSSEHQGRTDRATFKHAAYKDISLNLTGAAESQFPWLSLDQPCMGYAFGKSAGTITFNYWVSKAGSSDPPTKFAGEVKPRKLKLLQILDRLQQLESGLDENPDELYRYLYSTLIEDPDRYSTKAHFGMEQQISDLIAVLTHPMWIDFSNPKNQVVAKFFDSPDQQKKQEFLHQLLLSVELYLRIHSNKHSEKAKRKLMLQLPPPIAWNLAVAQRWLEHMTVTKSRTSPGQSTFSFDMKSKKRQKDALHHFAEVLKWPNMDEIEYVLEELDRHEKPLEDRSADAMSWFSGLVLPGRTLPWLIMNSLIDCDRDTGDALKYLTHMQPATGFQYRANTYWSSQSIVGKVLGAARGVQQIAGWIGPCIYTPDLKRTECVRLRQYQSLDPRLLPKDVESMDIRTNPLGPEDVAYPIADYEVPIPDTEDVTDLIRMEKLSFVPTKEQPTSRQGPGAPLLFDAAIWFACGGESWPMKLKYDVEFINAFPCHQGPHVLFYDFQYTAIKIDSGLVDIHDWATQSGLSPHRLPSLRSSPPSKKASSALTLLSSPNAPHSSDPNDPESSSPDELAHMQVKKVLTIEALGVSDNEVFARAWCADRGHSAVVANVNQTCMACAIREAYAACVSVVILTEGGKAKEKDDDVGVLLDDDDD